MPNLKSSGKAGGQTRPGGQTRQGGYHTDRQIKKTMQPAYARDDLDEAFAGNENQGPAANKKISDPHSTALKSRKTPESRTRTPRR